MAFTFANVPGVQIGGNINLNNDQELPLIVDEESQLPPVNFYISNNYNSIPYINVEILKKHINKKLSEIYGLKFKYNEDYFRWEIEWGTLPIEESIEDYEIKRIINIKKWWAMHASQRAMDKFPHNHDFDDQDITGEMNTWISGRNTWFKGEIILNYNITSNYIYISYNRLRGETYSFYNIINQIREFFDETQGHSLFNRELNVSERLNYLKFIEGSTNNIDTFITRTIYDDVRMKEISKFL
jgi:hypothetical protein